MFLKVVLFCSQGLGRIYRQVQWKFYYLNKGKFMGLSNEISFILIFLAVPVQQVKMFCSKLAVRRYLSSSVCICIILMDILESDGIFICRIWLTRKNLLRGFCLVPPGGVHDKILKCDKKVWRNYTRNYTHQETRTEPRTSVTM